ncbi:hypothetical protein ACP4OV_009916 [Aristida adscensionis]
MAAARIGGVASQAILTMPVASLIVLLLLSSPAPLHAALVAGVEERGRGHGRHDQLLAPAHLQLARPLRVLAEHVAARRGAIGRDISTGRTILLSPRDMARDACNARQLQQMVDLYALHRSAATTNEILDKLNENATTVTTSTSASVDPLH